jgi:hypothetical protein
VSCVRHFSRCYGQNRVEGYPDRPLGPELGIDFNILILGIARDEPWLGKMQRGEISQADLQHAVRSYNNAPPASRW